MPESRVRLVLDLRFTSTLCKVFQSLSFRKIPLGRKLLKYNVCHSVKFFEFYNLWLLLSGVLSGLIGTNGLRVEISGAGDSRLWCGFRVQCKNGLESVERSERELFVASSSSDRAER